MTAIKIVLAPFGARINLSAERAVPSGQPFSDLLWTLRDQYCSTTTVVESGLCPDLQGLCP